MILIFLTILLSLGCTFFIVPFTIKLGNNFKILDFPNSRKNHKLPIVRIGGLAIFLGWLISSLIVYFLKPNLFKITIINSGISLFEIIICSFLFFIIGFSDDIKRLSPYTRLLLQFLIASISWGFGLSINYLNINFLSSNFGLIHLPVLFSYLITTFFIVGIINAVNWWDGLDGLATGTTIISVIFLLLINLSFYGNIATYRSLLIASFLGSLIGFLIHNYHPAKILMGDGGSYFLGFSLSYLVLLNNSPDNIGKNLVDHQNAFPSVSFIVLLPILIDMMKVIYLRLRLFKLLFKPDRLHLHHDLLKFGLSEREAVIQMYSIVCMISSISLLFLNIEFNSIYFFIILIAFLIISFTNLRKIIFN